MMRGSLHLKILDGPNNYVGQKNSDDRFLKKGTKNEARSIFKETQRFDSSIYCF